jgi:outer membrane protein assembly factor BamB
MLFVVRGWGKSTSPPPHPTGRISFDPIPIRTGPVPINAVCPECSNRFQLQEAMIGKSMRCPNCQEVFIVKDAGGGSAPPAKPEVKPTVPTSAPRTRTDPPVVSRSGNVTDFVQVIKDVSAAAPPAAPIKPKESPRADKVKPPTSADFPWDEGPKKPLPPPRNDKPQAPSPAEFPWDEASRPKPTPPKAKTWTPDFTPPTLPPAEEYVEEQLEDYEEEYVEEDVEEEEYPDEPAESEPEPQPAAALPSRKKRHFAILIGLIAFVVAGLGTGGFFLWKYLHEAPDRAFATARKEYEAGNFNQARAKYQDFIKEYPKDERVPEARFFGDLADVRQTVASVMTRSDPQPGVSSWKKFLETVQDAQVRPFAAKERFGIDIWQTGIRLAEAVIGKANDSFTDEDPAEAEKWLNETEAIVKALDQFQPPDAVTPPALLQDIAALRQRIDSARARLVKLNQLKKDLGDGSDEEVAKAKANAKLFGMEKDPGFTSLLETTEERIQAKAVYTREAQSIAPSAVPDDGLTSLLFAPRFDRGEKRPIAGVSAVFYCLARGVLYALDEGYGNVLWAARTGLDTDIMPVRVPQSALNSELVLVASNTGNQFGITARAARNGAPLWHQSLAVPCQGPPVVVGPNAYVSLGDRDGTILEISLATGEIIGRITIGRPLGPNLAARPGTGLLYIPAESRAVYIFDVDRHDENARRLDPIRVGVMNTGHPPGSLRGVPVFSNPDPNEPGPKFLVLGQADGLESMKLRAYRLPETPDGRPEEGSLPVEIELPGWASFPPYCDGEKLAIVTDKGEFGLYGLKLDRNSDMAMFAFPGRPAKPGEQRPSRGQVVLADEGVFWILAAGDLRKLRFGINAAEGVRLIPNSDPISVGEPLHAPQVNARRDTFVVVTQDGMTCRATAVNAINGEVRWRRELGMMAKGEPLRIGDSLVFLDHGGGFYRVNTKPLTEKSTAAWLIDPKDEWLIAQPARGFTAITELMRGPNDTALAILASELDAGKLIVRKFTGYEVVGRELPPGPPLAGQPIITGNWLILPLANGSLSRLAIDNLAAPAEQGPSWRAERLPAATPCYLAALNADEFFATEGVRSIVRWRWEANSNKFEMVGRLPLPERPAATPAVVPGSPPRVVVADAKGNLTMWDADKLMPPPERSWRPGRKNVLPSGPVTDGLHVVVDSGNAQRIVYVVDGRLVWLSPDADGPKWIGPEAFRGIEGHPVIVGDQIYLTDFAGIVRVLDAKTGKETGEELRLTGSHAFASAAVPLGDKRVLVPLVDGTVVLGELKMRQNENPAKAIPFVGSLIPN